jgi:hypothetical protein
LIRLLTIISTLLYNLSGATLHFNEHHLGSGNKNENTLLILGGIHGNEPGSYFSASILTNHYKITKGNLIIVPNVNFDSIIRDVRGVYGDMNRKFAYISEDDKDYEIIQDIKALIKLDSIDFILNLHDGHGFYRKKWISTIFNPRAWGQACIIDQDALDGVKFGNLDEITSGISKNLNRYLDKEHHLFNVKNTQTKFKDEQMQLSLTYFAIRNGKPAVAIETSKNLNSLEQKVKYQLLAIEEFMKSINIEFERDFEMENGNVKDILMPKESIVINNSFVINPNGLKKSIKYFPMSRDGIVSVESNHPLVAIRKMNKRYDLMCGNQLITKIYPDYVKKVEPLAYININIDGELKSIDIASEFKFKEYFNIQKVDGYRVNVIGFSSKRVKNEVNLDIKEKDLMSRYSMHKDKRCYRVEIYKNKDFAGMVLGCKE